MKTELKEYGLTAYIKTITPRTAKEMLETMGNPKNRNISDVNLANYSRMMRNGDWMLNGEAVIIQSDGIIANGHNRLNAIIRAGVPVDILVIEGVSPEAFVTYDSGQKRKASHVLQMEDIPNSKNIAAVVTSVAIYRDALKRNGSFNTYIRPSNLEISAEYNKNPQLYQLACKLACRTNHICTISSIGMVYAYALIDGNRDYDSVEYFCEKLATGRMLEIGDPVLALRETLIRAKSEKQSSNSSKTSNWYKSVCIAAWNACMTGKKLRIIKVLDQNKAIQLL